MTEDRNLREPRAPTELPLWRLLAPPDDDHGDEDIGMVRFLLLDDEKDWRSALLDRIATLPIGGTVLVASDRPWARTAASLMAHRRWRKETAPSTGDIERMVGASSAVVDQKYWVWPSTRRPRIVYPMADGPTMRWLQRSGVLGGGGRRLWTRALARSHLFTPLGRMMAPGVVLAVRKPSGNGDGP